MGRVDEDLQYLSEVALGDEKALVKLMDRHKESLFHFALRYIGNEADAAEITENTFYRVFQKAHTFKPKSKVKTWIFSIALNLCRDALRKQKKHRLTISLDTTVTKNESEQSLHEKIQSAEPDPARESVSSDEIQMIETAIQRLPDKLRFPFVFCALESHSHSECGQILKCGAKTVEMRIYRARKRIQEVLESTK